jgi:hypothetical protein
MAQLKKAKEIVKELDMSIHDMHLLFSQKGLKPNAWSAEQELQMSRIIGAIVHMQGAFKFLIEGNQ